MPNALQRIACKAVVIAHGKLLILREAVYADGTNTGHYILPGGRLEPGEPYRDGLAREVYEETGLHITAGMPLYVGEWFPVIGGQQNQIVAVFFECRANTSAVRLSDEHDVYKWIRPQDHARYSLVTPEADVIQAYLRFHTAGLFR